MKLTSPHLATVSDPTIVDVANAIDDLGEIHQADPGIDDCFVLIESDDNTGAFIQAICVDAASHWRVEVSNADEASLRGLRAPATRGKAVELLGHFVQGDRSMGNGQEWLDVDLESSGRRSTPVALAIGILAILIVATAIWFYSRNA